MSLACLMEGSLARRMLVKLALRVGLIIVAMTGITYFHVVSVVTDQNLGQLEKYITERGKSERTIFRLATENHQSIKEELLYRLGQLGDSDPKERFDKLFRKFSDGTTRNRLEGFDGTRDAFGFIGRDTEINADIRRRVLTFLDISREYGAAWHHVLQNVYFTTPENILVGYWPEVPTWAHDVDPELYMPDEEYVWAADREHNPTRVSVWTGLFYDSTSKTWMISAESPVDIGDKQIATIGHDIPLNEIMERTINDRLDGAHNFIVRNDGRLIVHPDFMEDIQKKGGNFDINDSGNAYLKTAFGKINSMGPDEKVVEFSQYGQYLAVARINEAGLNFVTVYPRSLVSGIAFSTARIVLLLGLASLVFEILIIYFVIRKDVAVPLTTLAGAANKVASGDYNLNLKSAHKDELGRLATSFNDMSVAILKRKRKLTQSEGRFRTLATVSPVGIYRADKDGMCLYVNERCCQIAGFTPQSAAGEGWAKALHPEDAAWVFEKWQETVAAGGTFLCEHRFLRPDGKEAWVLDQAMPETGNDGELIGYVGTITDITERKETEGHLRQTQKMEALGNLTGGVAHEFNNLLMGILGALEILKGAQAEDSKMHKWTDMAINSSLRGRELVKDLLSYSRQKRIVAKESNVSDVVSRVVTTLQTTLEEHIEIKTTTQDTPWNAFIDADELEGALINLAINARDAMPGGGVLTIKSANTKLSKKAARELGDIEPGDYVAIAVSDTGSGMPAEIVEHAFDPFFTTKEVGAGSGLGLSMVYGFARQSGGSAEIKSDPGKGTTVTIYLPRSSEKILSDTDAKEARPEAPTGNETILLVEDEPSVRTISAKRLEDLGYRVVGASNGFEALKILNDGEAVDLLFSDVVMPGGMSGVDLAAKTRALHPQVRVLLCTGYSPEVATQQGKGEEGFPIIAKPYRKEELARKLRDALGGL